VRGAASREGDVETFAKKGAVAIDAGDGERRWIADDEFLFCLLQTLNESFSLCGWQKKWVFGSFPSALESKCSGDGLYASTRFGSLLLDPAWFATQHNLSHFKLDLPPTRSELGFVAKATPARGKNTWLRKRLALPAGIGMVANSR